MLKHIFRDSLKEFIKKTSDNKSNRNVSPVTDFPQFSCYMQAVERAMKLVTESALNVCGSIGKERYIRGKINWCLNMPKFNTKKTV